MPAGDVQIAIPNGATPTSKEVVGQTAIRPKAVNATFDGSGAFGPFLPCLVITGKEGFEVARIPAPQVAAGASAEVSWFPRVGGSSTVTAATPREILGSVGATSVPGTNDGRLPWAKVSGSDLLDLTNPLLPSMVTEGVYAVTATVYIASAVPGPGFRLQLTQDGPDFADALQSSPPRDLDQLEPYVSCTLVHHWRSGQLVIATVYNFDTVPQNFYIASANVQRLS